MDGFNQSNYLHINTNAQAMTWTSQHIQSSSHTSLHTQNPIQTHVHQHTYKQTNADTPGNIQGHLKHNYI